MKVRDLVFQGGGMIVAFDDNSVAHVVWKVVNGRLTLTGLSTAQQVALDIFNRSRDDSVLNHPLMSDTGEAIDQFRLYEDQIQFIGEPYAASTGTPADVTVHVTDDTGNRSLFTVVTQVTVNISGGGATNKRLVVNGVAGAVNASAVVTLVDGQAELQVTTTSAGTVDLTLTDSGSSGLDVSDTATVTFA